MEAWQPIPDHPGYEASSLGRCRGKRGQLLAQRINDKGYPYVRLYVGRRQKIFPVHQLICAAFHGPRPFPDAHAAHWDGVKTNVGADNLRWATPLENAADNERHGTRRKGSAHGKARLTEADVLAIKVRLAAGETKAAIARDFRVARTNITSIASGRTWGHLAASL